MVNKDTASQTKVVETEDWLEEDEGGQLAIDAYQNRDNVIIKAPIAGVASDNLEISITDEVVTIKGERKDEDTIERDGYFCQECYWGSFSRSYILPVAVDANKAEASLKNGILTIVIPKQEKSKTRILQVKAE
jgi:HSP20 family protein